MDELVKRLRECASGECFNCSQYTETTNASVCSKELMKQVADAIEELSKRVPPVPHGRLIDADVVFKRLQKQAMSVWGNGNPRYQIVLEVMDAIRFAPTILPAEEGET